MSNEESVSEWFMQLKAGEAEAAQKLWERYSQELIRLARKRLNGIPRAALDEEDIALSVFSRICNAAANGRFSDMRTRDDLWWLLMRVTKHKAIDYIRREMADKRGGGRVKLARDCEAKECSAGSAFFESLESLEPTPEFLFALEEEYQMRLGKLRDERQRIVARMRIEGYTVSEIASALSIGLRAVERKLQVIRELWSEDLSGD